MPTQPNRIVAAIRAVLPNAAWDLIKNIGQVAYQNWALVVVIMGFIASGLTALINRLRGIPSDAVGILVLFGIVVLVALFSYVIGRVRDRKRTVESRDSRDVSEPPLTPPDSGILTENKGAIRVCSYELVHRIADHQAKVIRDFVSVSRVAVWEHKLNDAVPTIKWGFMIKNNSLFPITLVEVRNNLFFENTELAERRFESTNEVQQLPQWREGSVVFEQRLSGPEAQHIRSMPDGKFRFANLVIKVGSADSFPVVEPQPLEIGNDLVATLNEITYQETQGMISLRKERDYLQAQLRQEVGPNLTFEVDGKESQVNTTGGGTAGRRISVKVRLRCMKLRQHPLAIREFHAALIKENGAEQIIVPQETSLIVLGYPDMKPVDFTNGWTIVEPLSDYRWFIFFLEITEKQLESLTLEYFIRITMFAIGQKPYSVDFDVDNWQHAHSSNSYITVRGKGD